MKFALAGILLLASGCREAGPQAVAGILDLSEAPLRGRVQLDGAWEFVQGEFLEPSSPQKLKHTAKLPGYWDENPQESGAENGRGFGTYRLTVRINSQDAGQPLGVYVPHAFTSYRMFIDGREAASNGSPGTTEAVSVDQFLPEAAFFSPRNEHFEILVHTANYRAARGGFRQSIELGPARDILRYKQFLLAVDVFLCGSILSAALTCLFLYVMRRSETYSLWFSLCAAALTVYKLTTGEYLLVMLFPDIPWGVQMKLFFVSLYTAVPLFLAFVGRLYPEDAPRRTMRLLQAGFLLLTAVVLFARSGSMGPTLNAALPLILAASLAALWVFVRAVRSGRDDALLFLSGYLFLLTAVINDVLFVSDIVRTEITAPAGLFLLLTFHSGALLRRFARLADTVQAQANELQEAAGLRQKLYRNRLKAQRLELEITKKAIQPHFLINSLAAVRAWLLESPRKAGQLLDDFAAEMRSIQSMMQQQTVPLREEIELCRCHLNVMAARREKEYRFRVRTNAPDAPVPPLLFHTLLENAFTHMDTEEGTLAFLIGYRSSEDIIQLTFKAMNPGGGPAGRKPGSGLGLRYVTTRLEEIWPGKWRVMRHIKQSSRYWLCIQIQQGNNENSHR